MYCPQFTNAARTLFDTYGSYLLAQLSADAPLAAEAEAFRTQQQSLSRQIDEHQTARRASFETLATRDRARTRLGEAIRAFGFTVRRVTRNDFKAPLYQTYFPGGTGAVTTSALETKIEKVEHILTKLASETHPDLTVHSEPIRLALDGYREAVRIRKDARLAATNAYAALGQEKRRWIDAYRQIYAKLLLFYHDNPRLAETYFRKVQPSKQEDTEVETEVESVSEASAVASSTANAVPAMSPIASVTPIDDDLTAAA
jgi:hypothetical protein